MPALSDPKHELFANLIFNKVGQAYEEMTETQLIHEGWDVWNLSPYLAGEFLGDRAFYDSPQWTPAEMPAMDAGHALHASSASLKKRGWPRSSKPVKLWDERHAPQAQAAEEVTGSC